jgi:hypothetical protein
MRVILLGNHRISYTSETHHKKSLESLGHSVIAMQETEVTSQAVYELARHSDMFVWIRTHGWNTPGIYSMSEVLDKLKKAGVPTVAYHLDLYMPIPDRWEQYKNSDYMNNLQYFFTTDKQMAEWLSENTTTKGVYLPAGVYHAEAEMIGSPINHEVIFTGSKNYHEIWPYRPQLVDWLEKTYMDRFTLYGNDGVRVVRGLELNQLYGSTKVVIGDTLSPDFDYPDQFSDRLFEVAGRGGFQIFPYIKGLEDHFEIDKEIVTYDFGNFDQLKEKIDYYIEHDDEREAIRLAGHQRAKKDHTYVERWRAIIKEVGL